MIKLVLWPLLIMFAALPVYGNDVVTMAIGDWEPFTSGRADNANVSEELVREAFKLENLDVEFKYFPWIRSYKYVEKGEYQATFPWTKSVEREEKFFYNKEPLLTEQTVLFHLKSKPLKWENYSDLKGLRIGGTLGYATGKILEDNGLKLDYVSKEDFNYQKLLRGRLDIYPSSYFVGYHQINMLLPPTEASLFTHHPKVLEERDYYMLFSKSIPNAKQLIDRFDRGLKKLKASGRYDEILLKITQPHSHKNLSSKN